MLLYTPVSATRLVVEMYQPPPWTPFVAISVISRAQQLVRQTRLVILRFAKTVQSVFFESPAGRLNRFFPAVFDHS